MIQLHSPKPSSWPPTSTNPPSASARPRTAISRKRPKTNQPQFLRTLLSTRSPNLLLHPPLSRVKTTKNKTPTGPAKSQLQAAVETHWAKMQLEVLEQKIRDDLEIDEKARGGRKDIKDSVVGGGNDKPSQPEGPDSVNGITHKLKHTSIAANVNARPCRSHPSIVTIGPYKFTNPTAVKYLQILAMAFYTRFLVLPAFNGPKELFLTIWRIAIVLGLHVAVLNYMGWKDAEHGIASDIFVEPVVYAVAMLAYLVRERGQGVLRFQGEGLYGL
ncbi:hypothetical protein BCR34DRAFT_68176 [Clohesyomyces aquaticus]|uniref:Uncharacterized protein n=1 Tax=Clohesyomyces aquaticus TaxID=1231657 RepID=A0A1Y1Z0P3_9PLEO|nr:hypothetical protein BCR34DRAFT_68176 [Clohesyomyces aquaticus]